MNTILLSYPSSIRHRAFDSLLVAVGVEDVCFNLETSVFNAKICLAADLRLIVCRRNEQIVLKDSLHANA